MVGVVRRRRDDRAAIHCPDEVHAPGFGNPRTFRGPGRDAAVLDFRVRIQEQPDALSRREFPRVVHAGHDVRPRGVAEPRAGFAQSLDGVRFHQRGSMACFFAGGRRRGMRRSIAPMVARVSAGSTMSSNW